MSEAWLRGCGPEKELLQTQRFSRMQIVHTRLRDNDGVDSGAPGEGEGGPLKRRHPPSSPPLLKDTLESPTCVAFFEL